MLPQDALWPSFFFGDLDMVIRFVGLQLELEKNPLPLQS
jgi:hypothetical protein